MNSRSVEKLIRGINTFFQEVKEKSINAVSLLIAYFGDILQNDVNFYFFNILLIVIASLNVKKLYLIYILAIL